MVELLDRYQPMTVGDLRTHLGDSVAYTTVMTVVYRLFEKGVVHREKVGRSYLYRLAEGRSSWLDRAIRRFGGSPRTLVNHLIEELTDEELKEVEQLIERRRGR